MTPDAVHTIPDEVVAAKLRFDAACLDWGWQADQGHDGKVMSSSFIEYHAASDALTAAISKAITAAVMGERDRCAGIASAHARQYEARLTKKRSDHDIAVFESAASGAISIAASIRRAAPKAEG
jgi:hypothetical protein